MDRRDLGQSGGSDEAFGEQVTLLLLQHVDEVEVEELRKDGL